MTIDIIERLDNADYHNAPSRCMEAAREIAKLRDGVDEANATIARIWKALGIETYEQAGGKEISEIVAALKAEHARSSERTDATRAALRTALGQWRMYAEMYETGGGIERDFDIEKEKSPEADMYRRCKAALSVDVVSSPVTEKTDG